MSVITREPVMLDSTGQQIANAINSLEQSLDVKRVQKSASDAVEAANKASKAATDASNQINTALSAVQSAASLMDFNKEFTVPGNPVVGKFAPGKPLGIQMSLLSQQSGSGTPSPSNVRPIVAQTGKVSVCGKNYYSGGDVEKKAGSAMTAVAINTIPAGSYVFSANVVSSNKTSEIWVSFRRSSADTRQLTAKSFMANSYVSFAFNLTEPCERMYFYAANSATESNPESATFTNIQIELGSTATPYEPYSGTTYTPSLPSDFAGGTINLSKPGDLSGYDKKLVLTEVWDELTFVTRDGKPSYLEFVKPSRAKLDLAVTPISTHWGYEVNAWNMPYSCIGVSGDSTQIRVYTTYKTASAFKAYLDAEAAAGHPVTIYYRSTEWDKSKDLSVDTVTMDKAKYTVDGTVKVDKNGVDEAATLYLPRQGKPKANNFICSHVAGEYNIRGAGAYIAANGYDFMLGSTGELTAGKTADEMLAYFASSPMTIVYDLATPITLALSDKTTVCGIEGVNTIIGDCQTMTVTGERHIAFEESPTTKLEKFIENYYNMRRTPEIYQTKIWKFASNPTSACEKLMANADLNYTPATDTDKGVDDYENIPLFQWVHCNYVRDKYGVPHPTAIEGMPEYRTDGSVDVGVMQMSFYVKWDDSNKDYTLLSISGMPFDGAKPWCECVGSNDKILPYCIGSAYYSGIAHDGKLRSQPNLKPENFMSHDKMLTEYQKKGEGYWGAGGCRNTFGIIFSLIKGANKSSQNLYQGCTNYNLQYDAAEKSATALDYFPVTEAQAANFVLGSCVSVGYGAVASDAVSKDRGYGNVHKYADKAKITKIAKVKDGVWGIYLSSGKIQSTADVKLNDTLTSTVFISTMPWWSGSTDAVMGHRDGSAASNSNAKMPFRVQGREYMIGAYTVSGDTVVDCISDGTRVYYVADRWTKHSNTDATIRSTYKKAVTVPNINAAADFWLGDIGIDPVSGASYPAAKGSSASTGVGDYFYWGGSGTGTREQLCCGYLWSGSGAGFSYVSLGGGRSGAVWGCVAAD